MDHPDIQDIRHCLRQAAAARQGRKTGTAPSRASSRIPTGTRRLPASWPGAPQLPWVLSSRLSSLLSCLLSCLLFFCCMASAAPGSAATTSPLRILSLNAEHLMSRARFERWQQFCSRHNWQPPRDGSRPPELNYCDALNGRDQQGRLLYGALRSQQDLDAKVAQLSALLARARPDIVLLQEVSDREAAASVLGPGWEIHSTAEHWPAARNAQNLVVAWRPGRFIPAPRVELVAALARTTDEGHYTRPGLALHLEPRPGLQLAILNVHLKAGCRHGRMERAGSRDPARYWRRLAACRVLQAQIPPLEAWFEQQARAGRQVLISGDFNRDLRQELKSRLPARADGSPASATPAHSSTISSLLAELDDNEPPGSRLMLVPSGPYRRLADCHRHITPFLLSHGLLPWLGRPADRLRVEVLPFGQPLSLERPRPSDHCPHLLVLPLR